MNLHAAIIQLRERQRASRLELKLARKELARRLGELNGEAGRLAAMHSITVSRELFDSKMAELNSRLTKVEGDLREQAGRLWLPMIVTAAVAASLAALVVKLLAKG